MKNGSKKRTTGNKNRVTFSVADMEQVISNELLATKEIARLDTPCRLHIHSLRYRLADSDGVSAKAAIDGLVHAGLLVDDSAKYVKEVSYSQEKIKKPDKEKTIITIKMEGQWESI